MKTPAAAALAASILLTSLTGCSSGFQTGLNQKVNPWAEACTDVGVLLEDTSPAADQEKAVDDLSVLVDRYGVRGEDTGFRDIVGPVATGAKTGDLGPARDFSAANC